MIIQLPDALGFWIPLNSSHECLFENCVRQAFLCWNSVSIIAAAILSQLNTSASASLKRPVASTLEHQDSKSPSFQILSLQTLLHLKCRLSLGTLFVQAYETPEGLQRMQLASSLYLISLYSLVHSELVPNLLCTSHQQDSKFNY